jgi:hypothetical protein
MPRDLDRRQFVSLLSAAGAVLTLPRTDGLAPRIAAETTVFWRQPDGWETLVRFFIADTDAPAGRLRVFDSAGRLLGTAGAIRIAPGRLYGELWLGLPAASRITTELAIPGQRPIRTSHTLTPKPKWNIYWITVVSTEELRERLERLPLFHRGVELALLRRRGVALNPLPADAEELRFLDHLDLLRSLEPAARAASELGVGLSRVAVAGRFRDVPQALALLLRDWGVPFAVATDESEPPAYWFGGPGGARVLVATGLSSWGAAASDFHRGLEAMKVSVERWLGALPAAQHLLEPMALVVDRTLEGNPDTSYRNVEAWNRLYSYPRIVVGEADEFFRRRAIRALSMGSSKSESRGDADPPSISQISAAAQAREGESQRRREALISVFARACGFPGEAPGKPVFPFPGWLVFNPSPFTRTDLVEVGEGAFRLVTDVPGTGYAYLADLREYRPVSWRFAAAAGEQGLLLENQRFRVRLSPQTGAIQSVLDRWTGFEWVRSHGELNGLPAARLERALRYELEGLASRITVSRWSPGRGMVESSVTVYRDRHWIDIENRAEAVGEGAVPYSFDFALTEPELFWETPLGTAAGVGPLERFAALRWIRLSGAEGRAYVSARDTPLGSLGEDRRLTLWGPRGRARFRLELASAGEFARVDEAWRFGWSIEEFLAIPVAGGGDLGLPRWGSLFFLREPAVVILGVEPVGAAEAVVYLQELMGLDRRLTLAPGVLRFEAAALLDLSGRTLESVEADPEAGVTVPLAARGVAAVRLSGLVAART